MSRSLALDNICLRPARSWGHTEYSLNYHKEFLAKRTGLVPEDADCLKSAYDRFRFDFLFVNNDGLVAWDKGRLTDMGHADYAADGSDQRPPRPCPFSTPEEVWAFDAVEEYGLPDFNEQVAAYENQARLLRNTYPNQLCTGGYYKTIISGAIQAFGWDMLLLAASDAAKMEKVFDGFFRRTLFFMEAWARTSAEVIIQHDDFVWTRGAFMNPDIYRTILIPRYAELWKPLHAAGKKVLFCSDGHYTEFMGDLAAAGADGFIFEPCNDFDFMADTFGRTHCLVGSFVDCRDLAFGNKDAVLRSLDRTVEALQRCRGAIVVVGNHLAPNIPGAMLDFYFDNLIPLLDRRG